MARIIKDAEERRVELLETARRLFYQGGYEDTSVQAITEEVGLAKGTFYHYFDSKEDLLRQLADMQASELLAALQHRVENVHESALDELRAMVSYILAFKSMDKALRRTYLDVFYRDENILLRHKFEESYADKLVPLLAHVVAQGVEEGVIDVDDPNEAAEIVLSLGRHGLSERLVPLLLELDEHPEHLDEIVKKVAGVETAMGRILGIKDKAFNVYDVKTVREFFAP